MKDRVRASESWQGGWQAVAAWTVVALLFAGNSYASRLLAGRPAPFAALAANSWLSWIFFAFVTVAVAAVLRSYPLTGSRRWRGFAVLAACGVVVLVVMAAWDVAATLAVSRLFDITELVGPLAQMPIGRLYQELFIRNSAVTLLAYAGTVAALQSIAYRHHLQERELRASQLEMQLAQSRLAALSAQLQPHFLFNTLNSIAALVRSNPGAAERMIVLLSDLLRSTVSATVEQETTLRNELETLGRYLEIERMRFSDRLRVVLEPAPETLDALVPTLILQPLVENAISHGIAPRMAPGAIAVRSQRKGDIVEIEVADDGIGLAAGRGLDGSSGVGLSNTRERLLRLYGGTAGLELAAGDGGGLTVRVRVPFRTAARLPDAGRRELMTA